MKKAGTDLIVAVWMVTYNHENYISAAIESVVSQKTNFKFRLFIGEDCSTDETRAICRRYAEQWPDLITLIETERNNYRENYDNVYRATFNSGAKYIAMLEGDDYWLRDDKLQQQVDFLDQNPEYIACFASIEVLNEIGKHITPPAPFLNFVKDVYTVEEIIFPPIDKPISLPIPTLIYRNVLSHPLPELFYKTVATDGALALLLGDKGKFRFMNEKTAAYRQHAGGITKSKEFFLKFDRSLFDLYDDFNEYTHHKYHEVISRRLFPMSKLLLMYGSRLLKGKERRKHIFRMLRGYNKYKTETDIKEISYFIAVLFFPSAIKLYEKIKR